MGLESCGVGHNSGVIAHEYFALYSLRVEAILHSVVAVVRLSVSQT